MYQSYFENWEVKENFTKEYISLWNGWLGKESNKLELVTEHEWARFNELIRLIAKEYEIKVVNCGSETIEDIENIEDTLSSYEVSMNKESSHFSKYLLPKLECIITEEWDYTYILWHKKNGAAEKLFPLIKDANLEHFSG
tara:strand:+ start:102 stop:521 length:420 start_codon:yes stop_codon:yes gene_type:complete